MSFALLIVFRSVLGALLAGFCVFAFLTVWAARKWRRARKPLDPNWLPGVTILKPVRGVESPHVYSNFVSFCTQEYPVNRLQIVFGCLDAADPIIPFIHRLQEENPLLRIDLVVSTPEAVRGANLKVCNLLAMLPVAVHDLLILCDSDMRVEQDYVRRVVAPFRPHTDENSTESTREVGLVTCPYRGFRPQSLPAMLELIGIGADFIPSALLSRALEGVGFAFGSTIVLPRAVLKQIGGFEGLLDDLADDFRLGERTRAAGYEVVLSDYVVDDVLGNETFAAMWNRRLRWAKTVRSCRPIGYAGLFVTNGTAMGLLFCAAMGFNPIGLYALLAALVLRLTAAAIIALTCTEDHNLIRSLPLLPVSDLLGVCLYTASYFGNEIVWRGQRFKLLPGGKLEMLDGTAKQKSQTSG